LEQLIWENNTLRNDASDNTFLYGQFFRAIGNERKPQENYAYRTMVRGFTIIQRFCSKISILSFATS